MRLPLPPSNRLVTSTAAALLCTLPLLRAFAVAPARRLSPSFLLASTRPFASIPSPIMAATAASAASNGGLGDIGQAPSSSSSASTSQAREEKEESGERKPQWVLDLSRCMTRNNRDSHSRYIQLATVGPHPNDATALKPFVRTVVFRGFHNGADAQDKHLVKMITDSRSEKMAHLASYPHAEIAWYFVKTREQYRLSGRIDVISSTTQDKALQNARKQQWGNLSDNAKVQFLWPFPKHPSPPDQDPNVFTPELPTGTAGGPPDTFCLLLMRVEEVDHLELKPNPQQRTTHSRKGEGEGEGEEGEGGWEVIKVNP